MVQENQKDILEQQKEAVIANTIGNLEQQKTTTYSATEGLEDNLNAEHALLRSAKEAGEALLATGAGVITARGGIAQSSESQPDSKLNQFDQQFDYNNDGIVQGSEEQERQQRLLEIEEEKKRYAETMGKVIGGTLAFTGGAMFTGGMLSGGSHVNTSEIVGNNLSPSSLLGLGNQQDQSMGRFGV